LKVRFVENHLVLGDLRERLLTALTRRYSGGRRTRKIAPNPSFVGRSDSIKISPTSAVADENSMLQTRLELIATRGRNAGRRRCAR